MHVLLFLFIATKIARGSTLESPANAPKYLAISPYQSAFPHPIKLVKGDTVALPATDRESEWQGWVWCEDAHGVNGWVPEAYLAVSGNRGTALCDYDATELTVYAGEKLACSQETCGWYWCSNAAGESGWVPKEHLQIIQHPHGADDQES